MIKKILIINPFGIGDVLFSTVLISALRKICPESYIAYICNLKTKDILTTNTGVDDVFVFERDEYRTLWKKSKIKAIKKFINFWGEIKKRRFNTVFDLSLGKEYAFCCFLAGIKDRRGFDYKGRAKFLNHRIPFDGFNDKPVAEYYLALLTKDAIARPKADIISTILITTNEDRQYIDNFLTQSAIKDSDVLIGIAPGGGISFGKKDQDRRRWPVKKFAELGDKIIEKFNAKIILIWGPCEEELINEIKNLMKESGLSAPKTAIRQMAELCKRCDAIVCSEGGPLHIAASQAVRTVSIFGPVDEKVYGPYPKTEKNIVITSNASCRPCYKKFKLPECPNKKCLEDISADFVLDKLSEALQ